MSDSTKAAGVQALEIVPHLVVKESKEAIAFYERAFGAKEICRIASPDGAKTWHAAIAIGTAKVYLVDEFPEMRTSSPLTLGGSPVTIHLQVADADAVFARATEAGATVAVPLMDAFWGDRYGVLVDPFGHQWSVAHKVEDVSPETLYERMATLDPDAECAEPATA